MFLQNCDVDTTEEDLRKVFGVYGNITKAFVMNRNRNAPAVGIVEFESNDATDAVMTATNGSVEISGSQVTVGKARSKNHPDTAENRRKRTIFISNLDYNCEDWQIEDFCSQMGEVERVSVPKSPEGRNRGFGFVTFKDENDTNAALEKSGIEFNGRNLNIKMNEKQERGERKERRDRDDDRYERY